MKIFLFTWLLLLFTLPDPVFKIMWCSENEEIKSVLEAKLKKLQNLKDANSLTRLFKDWEKECHLTNPIVVVQLGGRTFQWPAPGTKNAGIYKVRLGVLGTRSIADPTMEEISCFFSDTLVVVDTLRFFTGLSNKVGFILKTNSKEYQLPRDKNTDDVILTTALFPKEFLGSYNTVTLLTLNGQQRQTLAQGVLYLFRPEERHVLKNTLMNRRSEAADCDALLSESVVFVNSFWGSKLCSKNSYYDYSQEEVLRRLTDCQ